MPLLSAAPATAETTSVSTYDQLVTAINAFNGNGEVDIINITADLPAITSSITFNGAGNNRTLDGANSHRAFNLTNGGVTVVMNDLILTKMQAPNGSGGGALRISPTANGRVNVELNRVTVRHSSAWYTGSSKEGGGLFCDWANVTINRSIFHDNRGKKGGGIYSHGDNCQMRINRSAVYNNTSRERGGGIGAQGGDLTITNSSIFSNEAQAGTGVAQTEKGGGISLRNPGPYRLRHITITGNSLAGSGNTSGGGLAIYDGGIASGTPSVPTHVENSIVYGNTDGDCHREKPLSTNTGNIIGTGNCGTPTGVFGSGGNPQLASSTTGSPPYYAIPASSPAIDAVQCLAATVTGYNEDQRGEPRPSPAGGRCDIGAYEYQHPPPPPPRTNVSQPSPSGDVGSGGGGGGGSDDDDDETLKAVLAPPVSTCLTLEGIAAYNINPATQCQRVNAMQIANPNIKEGDFVDAVDVWSWVMPNTQICFEAAGGSFTFIDTAAMPRTVQAWAACSLNGMTCGAINGPGMLVLLPGDPPPACVVQRPAAQAAPVSAQSLSNCMVRTQFNLNFRAAPDGEITGAVPHNATLTALERTAGWFKVDYHGERGWISAEYVDEKGTCG